MTWQLELNGRDAVTLVLVSFSVVRCKTSHDVFHSLGGDAIRCQGMVGTWSVSALWTYRDRLVLGRVLRSVGTRDAFHHGSEFLHTGATFSSDAEDRKLD